MQAHSTATMLKLKKAVGSRIYWIPLTVLVVFTALPLVWAVSASLKGAFEVYITPPTLIPEQFKWSNYVEVVTFNRFGRYFFNSAFLALSSTVITVVTSVLAGYGFARYSFRFSSFFMALLLIPRIIPRASLMIPLFRMAANIGLLDTYTMLILAYAASAIPIAAWVLTGFFRTIPRAIEEQAMIDGAKHWQVIVHIVLPISFPAILTVIIFSIRQAWNEFPLALTLTMSAEMRTLPYQLFLFRDSIGVENWPLTLAFTIITILPILVIYAVFQKHVVSGVVRGAVK